MTSEPITSEPSHVHALFDPASRYNRLRLAAGLDDKMRGYFHWLRSRQDRKETVASSSGMATAPPRRLVVRLSQLETATPADVDVRFLPRADQRKTIDVRLQLQKPKKYLVRYRVWLMDPAFWQRLRKAEPSLSEEPSAEGLLRLVNDETLRSNLEVARILSAIPELEGSVDESGSGRCTALALPDSCDDIDALPEDVFVVIVLDKEAIPSTPEVSGPGSQKEMGKWVAEQIGRLMYLAEKEEIPRITVDDKRAIVNEVLAAALLTEYRSVEPLIFYRAAAEAVREHILARAKRALEENEDKAPESPATSSSWTPEVQAKLAQMTESQLPEPASSTFAALEASTVSMARLEPAVVLKHSQGWEMLRTEQPDRYECFALSEFAKRTTKEIAVLTNKTEIEVDAKIGAGFGQVEEFVQTR